MSFDTVTKHTPVIILTTGFQVQGTMVSIGLMQTFLNDDQKMIFPIRDTTVHGMVRGNPAVSMNIPEIFISKPDCHAIVFGSMMSQDETGLMPRTEMMVAYTSHYAVQGEFHMGYDALIGDFIQDAKSMFIGVTNAYFFPLFDAQAALVPQSPLVYMHRSTILSHHLI